MDSLTRVSPRTNTTMRRVRKVKHFDYWISINKKWNIFISYLLIFFIIYLNCNGFPTKSFSPYQYYNETCAQSKTFWLLDDYKRFRKYTRSSITFYPETHKNIHYNIYISRIRLKNKGLNYIENTDKVKKKKEIRVPTKKKKNYLEKITNHKEETRVFIQ